MKEIALGKCWDKKVISEIFSNPKAGEMPFHNPEINESYGKFLSKINGKIIFKNIKGEETDVIETIA